MPPTVVQAAPELSKILAGHPKVAAKAAPQGQKTKYPSSKPGSTTTREFELPEDEVIVSVSRGLRRCREASGQLQGGLPPSAWAGTAQQSGVVLMT